MPVCAQSFIPNNTHIQHSSVPCKQHAHYSYFHGYLQSFYFFSFSFRTTIIHTLRSMYVTILVHILDSPFQIAYACVDPGVIESYRTPWEEFFLTHTRSCEKGPVCVCGPNGSRASIHGQGQRVPHIAVVAYLYTIRCACVTMCICVYMCVCVCVFVSGNIQGPATYPKNSEVVLFYYSRLSIGRQRARDTSLNQIKKSKQLALRVDKQTPPGQSASSSSSE